MLYHQKVFPIVVSFAIGIVLVYGHGVAAHGVYGTVNGFYEHITGKSF